MGEVLKTVWLIGMAAMGGFFLLSNLAFYGRLRKNRKPFASPGSRKVYLVPEGVIPSPCLFGRSIYITPAVASDPHRLRHVLTHEETHARHLDSLWSLLRCVCLPVYWFDSLVWMAAACAKTDCELACDESVLNDLGENERIPYGQTLLSLIPVKRVSNPMLAATTMTSGKKQPGHPHRQTAPAACGGGSGSGGAGGGGQRLHLHGGNANPLPGSHRKHPPSPYRGGAAVVQ